MDFRNLIKDVGRILLEMDSSAVAGRVNCIYGCTRRVRGCHSQGETDSSATGIGITQQDQPPDFQLRPAPGQRSNVTFQVWGHRIQGQDWPTFHYDVTFQEMNPNNPRRT
jgi:hypothetical protein